MSILHTRIKATAKGGYNEPDREVEVDAFSVARVTAFTVVVLVLLSMLSVGGCAGLKGFSRAQKRADANNNVKVTTINIRRARQQARIVAAQDATVKAQADQRLIKARGIKAAQDEIQSTLTPLYVQFEAIEAQKAIATSGQNNTVIYVPSGTNGTPTITANARTGK